jgi:hypothetical protein
LEAGPCWLCVCSQHGAWYTNIHWGPDGPWQVPGTTAQSSWYPYRVDICQVFRWRTGRSHPLAIETSLLVIHLMVQVICPAHWEIHISHCWSADRIDGLPTLWREGQAAFWFWGSVRMRNWKVLNLLKAFFWGWNMQ